MDYKRLIRELELQISCIDRAIAVLQGTGRAKRQNRRGQRRLSAEARRRISRAQKQRWAKLKNK